MSDRTDKLMRRLMNLERQQRSMSVPRLGNSSIDDGRLIVNDPETGEPLVYIGTQDDGSVTVQDVGGPAPAQPSAPLISQIPGGITVTWDGADASGSPIPWDSTLGYVSVRMGDVPGLPVDETVEIARLYASPASQYGGAVTVSQPAGVTTYVSLVATRRSGVESAPSAEVSASPGVYVDPVDLDPLNASLVTLQTDLDAAEADVATLEGRFPITTPDITAGAITTNELAALAVTAAKIAAHTITANEIAANTITANEIAAGTITANEIAAGTITANELAAGAVTTNELAAGTIEAGFVLSGKIQVGSATWTPGEGLIFPDTLVLAAAIAQLVTINGAPTGGTFTLSGNGATTSSIAYNAAASTVQTAVRTLGGAFSNANVTGSAGGPWTVDVGPILPARTLTATSSLTGGTSPSVAIKALAPPSSFTGGITATSLTVQKDLNLLGVTNQVKGTLTLANGIVAPTVAPTMWQSWDLVGQHSTPFGATNYGLSNHLTDTNVLLTGVAFFGGGITTILKSNGQPYTSAANATVGDPNYRSWCGNLNVLGGITTMGSYYYVLGSHTDGHWYVYQLDSGFNFVQSWNVANPGAAFPGRPAIGNDGANILYAWADGANTIYVNILNISTGAVTYRSYPSGGIGTQAMSFVGQASYDFGVSRTVISVEAAYTLVCDNVNSRLGEAYAFAPANGHTVRGLWWDGTRFWSYGTDGSTYKHATNIQIETVTSSYTWYDGDTSSGSTAHETTASPSTSFTRAARTFVNIQTQEAPDSGVTDVAQRDKANRVGIYAASGAATRRLQQYNGVDGYGRTIRTLRLDSISTGGQTETTPTGFVGATNSPGLTQSYGASGTVGWRLWGDGSAEFSGIVTGETFKATEGLVSGGNISLSGTGNVALTGASVTVTSPGTGAVYLVRSYTYVVNTAGHTCIIGMTVDGTEQAFNPVMGGGASMSVTISGEWRVTGLAAGSHTFALQGRMAAAGQSGTVAGGNNAKIVVQRVA